MLLISSIISGHHKNLLNPNVTQYGCNCRIREDCPLQNQCLTPNIFRNHNRDFNHEQYIKSTELSKYTWSLKDAGTPYTINWSINVKLKGSIKIYYYCPLCLTEKYHLIEYFNNIHLLNKKSEFIKACRHQRKSLLKNLKRNDSMD